MINRAVPVAILLATLPLSAFAQGITGGDLGIEYNAPLDGSDFGGTTYSGGVEYGFMRTFSMSVNAAAYKPDNISTTATNVTLHGTYQLSSAASVGGFYGYDSNDGEGLNLFGIEGGTEFMGGDVGAYIGRAEDDGTIFGIDGSYDLRSGFSVIGNVDLIDVDDVRTRLAAITGVLDVHDLHVWTLTSDMDVGTAHLMTRDGVDPHPVLDEARSILQGYGIAHATLQVEPESHEGCAEINW